MQYFDKDDAYNEENMLFVHSDKDTYVRFITTNGNLVDLDRDSVNELVGQLIEWYERIPH